MTLLTAARRLAALLAATQRQLVLAESCTGGLVAATLTRVPGISAHFCGSLVSYHEESKSAWLQIDSAIIAQYGAVSAEIATEMARSALQVTPTASIAAAVVGHLGPHAPPKLDGAVFIAIALREPEYKIGVHRLRLAKSHDRTARQKHAALAVLQQTALALDFLVR